jgi:hypothetical protein
VCLNNNQFVNLKILLFHFGAAAAAALTAAAFAAASALAFK